MWYLDTSAFLKLLVAEDESDALRAWLRERDHCWSAELLRTEALRAAARLDIGERRVEDALSTVSLMLPAAATYLAAGRLAPAELRSLDALHLAAALELGDDLEGIVTYDRRMIEGAHRSGAAVVSPA